MFKGQMGHCLIKCTSLLSEWEKTVPQWAFKLNSVLVTAENRI